MAEWETWERVGTRGALGGRGEPRMVGWRWDSYVSALQVPDGMKYDCCKQKLALTDQHLCSEAGCIAQGLQTVRKGLSACLGRLGQLAGMTGWPRGC